MKSSIGFLSAFLQMGLKGTSAPEVDIAIELLANIYSGFSDSDIGPNRFLELGPSSHRHFGTAFKFCLRPQSESCATTWRSQNCRGWRGGERK